MKKNTTITILLIVAVIILAVLLLNKPRAPTTDSETAKCIGENSVLYIQLGCHACKLQEDMFGDNYQYLNKVDCFYEKDKCASITATPTWIIDGKSYEGVQEIEALKELTGC